MDFDEYKDQAANYLEDLGIGYDVGMDDLLFDMYNKGVKPYDSELIDSIKENHF